MQLQRTLYLLGKQFPNLTSGPLYTFRKISSGEFSEEIYKDANLLAMTGLAAIDPVENGGREYRITAQGLERARELEKKADPEAIQFLRRTVAWVRTRSVDQLVHGPAEPAPPVKAPAVKPPLFSRR